MAFLLLYTQWVCLHFFRVLDVRKFAVVCRFGYNSVRHSLARTHLSGNARICAHIGMLGNPNQSTECFIRGGAQVPRQLVHLDKPVKA